MEFLKVQQGPGYFLFALFAVLGPWEHWEVPMPIAPHSSAFIWMGFGAGPGLCTPEMWHLLLCQCTMVSMCCYSATQRCSENKNCIPHTIHDFASSAPRNLQIASKDNELQLLLVHKPLKWHFAFCTQLTCTSGNPQHFTAELFSLLC